MPKVSGLGDQLYADGYDLSGDTGSVDSISCPRGVLDSTGIDKFAMERMYGLADGLIEFTTFFNPATDQAHDALSTLPTIDRIVSYFHGQAIGNPAASMIGKQIGFDPNRGDDGAFTFKISNPGNAYGLEWGEQLTVGKSTLTGSGALASYDYGAGVGTTNFGLQAYLHVFAFTGTSATVAIQSSTDNGAGDAFANVTGAAFTAATGRTFERIQTGRTAAVERYLRVNVTGTFSNFVFAVQVTRNSVNTPF